MDESARRAMEMIAKTGVAYCSPRTYEALKAALHTTDAMPGSTPAWYGIRFVVGDRWPDGALYGFDASALRVPELDKTPPF